MKGDVLLKQGRVISVNDDAHAGRVIVHIEQDNTNSGEYAFPLLPKYLQAPVAEGDRVFVITEELSNNESQRFYIGPIVSQPQDFESPKWEKTTAALKGSEGKLSVSIDNFANTMGAFPNGNETALIGKKSEDIILKDEEIDIRCGIRGVATNEPELEGKRVIFNSVNPAYIQLKLNSNKESFVNIVADHINIISHKGKDTSVNGFPSITDSNELIKKDDLSTLTSKLHPVPYADILIEKLNALKNALQTHEHNWVNRPPDGKSQVEIQSINFSPISSSTLSIS